MKIQVHYNGDTRGEIPYTSLPAFRLLCEQNGLQVRWKAEERTLYLNPGLTGIKIYLASGLNELEISSKKDNRYEHEVMKKTKEFLSDSGADITLLYDHTLTPSYGDLYIRLAFLEDDSVKKPKIALDYDWNINNKKLLDYLREKLQNEEMEFVAKRHTEMGLNIPLLKLQCRLPNLDQASPFVFLIEDIAITLASGILFYFHDSRQISPFSCLPLHALDEFIYGTRKSQDSSVFAVQLGEQERAMLPEREADGESDVPEAERIEVKESTEVVEAVRMQAEVFFDYTVLPSEREDSSYLVIGNLYIKNTGTEDLYNPVICLKATPADSIKLQGQILPANMVETLGTQSSDGGVKGWRYLQKDWFAEALERGEYWIAPVQNFRIAPEKIEAFHNFQLSILKPEEGNTVTIEGFVYFKERQVPFASNNRIVFSF
ncbi:hypothetical protein [Aneurinibacillus danicus]|uniref:Uncharacterized protein n=1 Tax=Aneurinibacillus danicus TaxID=267746 RepID=A0A511VGC6_9BACL|nr:hypothetical protein [Aneurinibacillus danicus]GEN36272.1 hypothetical protein ADA01nite_37320 [Aneurinibacillus danicus]